MKLILRWILLVFKILGFLIAVPLGFIVACIMYAGIIGIELFNKFENWITNDLP